MRWRNLTELEAVLTCPIALELIEDPVVTGCCGKTFSSEGLRQTIRRSPFCPLCRERLSSTHPNRDMAKLVELHRRERSVLDVSGAEVPIPAVSPPPPPHSSEYAVLPTASTRNSRRRSPSTRQSRHREHRSERVHARSEVSRRQSSRLITQTVAAPEATSITAPSNTAVVPKLTDSHQQVRSSASGLTVYRVGSGAEPTAVPPHMVSSVIASLRFPSVQSTAGGRCRRSRSRTASSATSTAVAHQRTRSFASRRRTPGSSAIPRATTTALSSAVPSATPNSTLQRRSRTTFPRAGAPTSAASIGALAGMPFSPVNAVSSSAAAIVSRNSQAARPSGGSKIAYIAGWVPHLVSVASSTPTPSAVHSISQGPSAARNTSSTSALVISTPVVSSTVTTAASTGAPRITSASHQLARFSASQDDSALGRQQHDSPRLTTSQPAPRQSLSNLARSITSLRDLLGSDFESDSSSN